jgi:hypothetical protein
MIQFSNCTPNNRAAAIVGDTIASAVGTPAGGAAPTWVVTTQPSGSDVFTGASDVAHATAVAATLSTSGYHKFTLTSGSYVFVVEVIVWPANALTYAPLKYLTPTSVGSTITTPALRMVGEQLRILQALAAAAPTVTLIQSALEPATAPRYGVSPVALGIQNNDSLRNFGGSW